MPAQKAKKLTDHSADELRALPYEKLCQLRRDHWAEHVKWMKVRPEIQKWAHEMADKYGPKVKIHGGPVADHLVDWPTALLIIRYGEATHVPKMIKKGTAQVPDPSGAEVPFWPKEFSDDDVRRADRWLNGVDMPPAAVVTYQGLASRPEG